MATATRLVTFLGLGTLDKDKQTYRYTPVRYRLGETVSESTEFVACAIGQITRPDEICVLATAKAQAHHGKALQEALRSAGLPAPVFEPLPDGADATQLWTQFDVLKRVLRGDAGTRILLDVTHGFRTQPFFAAGAVSFVRAVDAAPCTIEVLYGAFEARTPADAPDAVAPLWDLTPFVELTDWSQALRLFLLTGRTPAVMEEFVKRAADALVRAWLDRGREGEKPALHGLAKAFADFSADLATVRTGDLLLGRDGAPSASRLLAKLDAAAPLLEQHLPPLADVLKSVRALIEPLVLPAGSDSLATTEGHAALAALARMYLAFERYLEAATTVREGHATRYSTAAAAAPGRVGLFSEPARREADAAFHRCERQAASEVSQIRNDMNHGGYRGQPASAETLRRRVGALVDGFAAARRAEAPAATPLFLNLTNHPAATWDAAQREAAAALAGGPVVDVPFPAVEPHWTAAEVERLADGVVEGLPEASHALVMGEMTLTWALVQRLKRRGVACVATTSRRDVSLQADGGRLSRFVFEAFRAYP
jgi:CRISPR-associated protein Csx16